MILGDSSEERGTFVSYTKYYNCCVFFENDVHSTVRLVAEYYKLSVFICDVVFQYIYTYKVMCLSLYAKFEGYPKKERK